MDLRAASFINAPLYFGQDIFVYPAKVKDVLANPQYPRYNGMLVLSQEDIWDSLAKRQGEIPENAPTPFQNLMGLAKRSDTDRAMVEEAIRFFTHEPVSVRPEGNIIIFISNLDKITEVNQIRKIDEDNFFKFQNLIRVACGEKEKEPANPNENPRVALMKAKHRQRERLVKKKGSQSSVSLYAMLVAVCCMNLSIDLLNIGEISYAALLALFPAGQNREKYQTDIRLIAGGADSKKINPKHWIKEIE